MKVVDGFFMRNSEEMITFAPNDSPKKNNDSAFYGRLDSKLQ